jgi:predicted GIY-YIG superfamily endonuclease
MPIKKHRIIYCYEFEDNSAYIGLTCDLHDRHRKRFKDESHKNDSVRVHHESTGFSYQLKTLTDPLPPAKAQKMEEKFIKTYRKNGWKILNKAPAGSLGAPKKKK